MADDKDKNENVVIAIFDDEESANESIDGLKQWDRVNDEIKLGAIGTITKEGDKVKTHVGRKVGRGAAVGATVGVIAAALTGGAALIGGAIVAGTLGGVTGGFFKKSLHLSKEEVAQIGSELDAGKVAVVVTCDDHEIEPTTEYLTSPRSKVTAYKVPGEALKEVAETLDDGSDEASSDDASPGEDSPTEGEASASA